MKITMTEEEVVWLNELNLSTYATITRKVGTEIPGGGGGGTSPDSTALSLQWTALSVPFYLCITAGGKVTRQHP